MKNLNINHLISCMLLSVFMSINVINASARYSPKAATDISISIVNLTQSTDRTIEFDVYLLDTDPTQTFELTTVQLGLLLNSNIYTGGILSVSYDNTISGLLTTQQPTANTSVVSTLAGYPNLTLVRLASRTPPGAGNGSIISFAAPGTLMTHMKITSTIPWNANTKANLLFASSSASSPLYKTAIAEYIAGIGTPLEVNPGINAIVCCNPYLNPTSPTVYTVSGTGSYCPGESGIPVGLSNSDLGVKYQLYNGETAEGTALAGTGAALDFGNKTAGVYTVKATNDSTATITQMTGSAEITKNPEITPSVSITADNNPVETGTTVLFTATPVNGGTAPTYQWLVNSIAVGTESALNTYSYTPLKNDVVSVSMTTNASPCLTSNPVTSNSIIMDVTIGTGYKQNGRDGFQIYSMNKKIYLNCKKTAKQIHIYNMLGSLIISEKDVTGLKEFNMNSHPDKLFLVKVITDNKVFTQKILLR